MSALENKLKAYMDAGFPILYLHTFEEARALSAVEAATSKMGNGAHCMEYTNNLVDEDARRTHITMLLKNSTFLDEEYRDYNHTYISDLKDYASRINPREGDGLELTIVIISPVLRIPKELEKEITVVPVDFLTTQEIETEIKKFVQENEIIISETFLHKLSEAFKGMSTVEIHNILRLAVATDNLTQSSLSLIFEQKQQMILKSGLLEMVPQHESISDIGGLENLKQWLVRKAHIFSHLDEAKRYGVDIPKGVLITGLPGNGKSLTAKAAAKQFGLPLLRMDMGRLFGKYLGESEANMRRAIELTEATAPCVLWIDEMEKAFAGIDGNSSGGEVTTRLFGSFLTWMQEKDSPVFVVATANDVMNLPPELLRKGRFDEIFFVGLPSCEERQKIFEIHIRKRRESDIKSVDCRELAEQTKGYSGADIEGVIREAVEISFMRGNPTLTTELIESVLKNTSSLSEIMSEQIGKMEKEYKRRKFKSASDE